MDVLGIVGLVYPAKEGHFEILKWLRANGCPWDKWTYFYAIENGYHEIAQWAKDNGCPKN